MPRGHVNKQEIQTRVYKLKTALYDSTDMFNCFSDEKKAGAHDALKPSSRHPSRVPRMKDLDFIDDFFESDEERIVREKNDVLMEEPCLCMKMMSDWRMR